MILLVDVGNTNIKWAWFDGGKLREMQSLPHNQVLPESVSSIWSDDSKPAHVYVSNVAGHGMQVSM